MSILSKVLEFIPINLHKEVMTKLATATLQEGATIEAEEFAVGQVVFVVSEDGEKMPLPEGEYTLEDGSMLVIDAESKIAEVKSPEQKEEEVKEETEEVTEELAKKKKEEKEEEPKEEVKEEVQESAPVEAKDPEEDEIVNLEEDKPMTEEMKKMVEEMVDAKLKEMKEELTSLMDDRYGTKEEKEEEKLSAQRKVAKLKPNPDADKTSTTMPKINLTRNMSGIERALHVINNS